MTFTIKSITVFKLIIILIIHHFNVKCNLHFKPMDLGKQKNYTSCLTGTPPAVEFHIAGKYSSVLIFHLF